MLPLPANRATPDKRQLLRVFGNLSDTDKQAVLAFADFLAQRTSVAESIGDADQQKTTPQPIPRPEKESVVAAMRRLSDTYFMLNKDTLLHQASGLMSEHIMQGKSAVIVIDELEVLFAETYAKEFATELADH